MGLDTTHDCWHGAYSSFMRWRRMLAKAAGLPPLGLMEGFWTSPRDSLTSGGDSIHVQVAVSWLRVDRPGSDIAEALLSLFDDFPIRWEALKPDPLHLLLYHSDCDGEIASSDCIPIAESLERLLPLLPEGGIG